MARMSDEEKAFRKRLRTSGLNYEVVDSSFIRSASYEPNSETLVVHIINESGPSSYAYGSVPWRTAALLFNADSPGSNFNDSIKDSYAYVKLF